MNPVRLILPARIIGCLILFTAIVPVTIGIWLYASTKSFVAEAKSTRGTVVATEQSRGSDGGTACYVVFEFDDDSATTQRVVSRWASNPPSHAVGSTVEVLYAPNNPSDAHIRGFLSLWFGPTVCGVLTVPPIVLGLVFLWLIPFTIRRMAKS